MKKFTGLLVDLIMARVVLPVVMTVLSRILPKALVPILGPVVALALPIVAAQAWRFVKHRKAKVV